MRKLYFLRPCILLVVLIFASCVSQKRLSYFQDKDTTVKKLYVDTTYEATIQANDLLTIYVTSVSEESSHYFNFDPTPDDLSNSYVVDHFGNIQLPLVGDVHVAGLTTKAARDSVIHSLQKYLTNPSVRLNIRNFRVTVLGEVAHPGVYPVQNEKITLTEALGLAGDLKPFSLRENIMIIREVNGQKVFGFADITSRNFFSSPYYNLHTNDIVYVETARRQQVYSDNYFKLMAVVITPMVAILLALSITHVIKN